MWGGCRCGVCVCVGWDGGVDGQAGMKAEAGLGCETERDKHCLKSEVVCR